MYLLCPSCNAGALWEFALAAALRCHTGGADEPGMRTNHGYLRATREGLDHLPCGILVCFWSKNDAKTHDEHRHFHCFRARIGTPSAEIAPQTADFMTGSTIFHDPDRVIVLSIL